MNLKTILGYLTVAFVAWWVIENPHAASQIVADIGNFLTTAVSGLSNFFSSI